MYAFLLIIAIFKDLIQIIMGLIPFAGPFLSIFLSMPFTIIILTILLLYGKLGMWKWLGVFMAKILDKISIFLPITSLMIIALYFLEKTGLEKIASSLGPKSILNPGSVAKIIKK